MSGPIKYTDNQGGTVFIKDNGDYGCIDMATDDPEQGHVHVRGPMRQKIAQALAGGGYEVTERLADWERELLDKQTRIDPAAVKVGDVVEVEANDGSWLVRGQVIGGDSTQFNRDYGFSVQLGPRKSDALWIYTAAGTTVRLVRRAEPEPDPEQVEALASQLADVVPNYVSDEWLEYARELVRRGVTVRGATDA